MSSIAHSAVLIAAVLWPVRASAFGPTERVFSYKQAKKARRIARNECKPLVIHFVPDTQLGGEQIKSFYRGANRVPSSILDKVVIIAVPTKKFARFAKQLGVTGIGGYRTISPYSLEIVDEASLSTVRSGFI